MYLKEYLKSIAEDYKEEMYLIDFDFEFVTNEIKVIFDPVFNNSQIECLNYVAGYAIFSYLKKSTNCRDCENFLTSTQHIKVL